MKETNTDTERKGAYKKKSSHERVTRIIGWVSFSFLVRNVAWWTISSFENVDDLRTNDF